jgi:hypothetical protein
VHRLVVDQYDIVAFSDFIVADSTCCHLGLLSRLHCDLQRRHLSMDKGPSSCSRSAHLCYLANARLRSNSGGRHAARVKQAAVEKAGSTRLAVPPILDGPVDSDRARARLPCRCRITVPRDPWSTCGRCRPRAGVVVHVAALPPSA